MTTQRRSRGQPTKYEGRFVHMAYRHCLLGATDVELAELLEVQPSTIANWKNVHPEFLEAIKAGREEADARVAEALYHRALGTSHPEEKVVNVEGELLTVTTTRNYPPDTKAAELWLRNRQSTNWNKARNDTNVAVINADSGSSASTEDGGLLEFARRIAYVLEMARIEQEKGAGATLEGRAEQGIEEDLVDDDPD